MQLFKVDTSKSDRNKVVVENKITPEIYEELQAGTFVIKWSKHLPSSS